MMVWWVIDFVVVRRGAGSSLLTKPARIEQICRSMSSILSCPLTIKVGVTARHHSLLPLHCKTLTPLCYAPAVPLARYKREVCSGRAVNGYQL